MKIYREVGTLKLITQCDKEGYVRPVYEIEVDDAEPIRHGKWERDAEWFFCSECNWSYKFYISLETYKYCPNCGAKMDKELKKDILADIAKRVVDEVTG